MIGFNYTYADGKEIFSNMPHIWSMSFQDVMLVASFFIFTLLLVFIIIPSYIIIYRYIYEKHEKQNKKKLLAQILLQKEIEDEVEKEIHIEAPWEVT